ncbi:MAG: carboxypeptidase-like regulatory domain-containing protein, partial [Flavobacteriaceae bacterium]
MKFFAKNCFLLLISFFSFFHSISGQDVWVEDGVTGEPLENVVIFSENRNNSTLTNKMGKAILNDFPRNGQINFSLLGYQPLTISIHEVLQGKKVIILSSEDEILEEVVLSVARSQATRDKIAEQVA